VVNFIRHGSKEPLLTLKDAGRTFGPISSKDCRQEPSHCGLSRVNWLHHCSIMEDLQEPCSLKPRYPYGTHHLILPQANEFANSHNGSKGANRACGVKPSR
jgi:hypothetical protein